jgi:hypothetical protein
MSDTKTITTDVASKVGGGDCTVQDVVLMSDKLIDAYENLIEFTTYMMERVGGQ